MADDTHPEFMGLGAALDLTGAETATVTVERDDVVLRWPGGPTLYLNLRFQGVRTWLSVLSDHLRDAGHPASADALDAAWDEGTRRFLSPGTDLPQL